MCDDNLSKYIQMYGLVNARKLYKCLVSKYVKQYSCSVIYGRYVTLLSKFQLNSVFKKC